MRQAQFTVASPPCRDDTRGITARRLIRGIGWQSGHFDLAKCGTNESPARVRGFDIYDLTAVKWQSFSPLLVGVVLIEFD